MKNCLFPYLIQSADINYKTALNHCTNNHIDSGSCLWYHGIWQYLRLFNLVSSPSWHHRFYLKNLCKHKKNQSANVLISGMADYSMYAYVLMSARKYSCKCNITAIDLCKTPLINAQWYADNVGKEITTFQKSIFDVKGNFDIICADAFLTRFNKKDFTSVLQKWYALLNYNGRFITTIRIHDSKFDTFDEELAVEDFVSRAIDKAKNFKNLELSLKDIENKSRYYAINMKSNNVGTKSELLNEIKKQGFKIIVAKETIVTGEIHLTKYLRVVAQKT